MPSASAVDSAEISTSGSKSPGVYVAASEVPVTESVQFNRSICEGLSSNHETLGNAVLEKLVASYDPINLRLAPFKVVTRDTRSETCHATNQATVMLESFKNFLRSA